MPNELAAHVTLVLTDKDIIDALREELRIAEDVVEVNIRMRKDAERDLAELQDKYESAVASANEYNIKWGEAKAENAKLREALEAIPKAMAHKAHPSTTDLQIREIAQTALEQCGHRQGGK